MDWRLGLDLGTNSIGWTVLGLSKQNESLEPNELINMGSRIFSDGRDPKTKEPLAVARRDARGIRKNIRRRKQRRHQLFRQLQIDNLFPTERSEAAKLKAINPYEARIKALDSKLEPYELGRALFNLGVRRGFKSNRKDNAEEKVTTEQTENKTSDKMSQGDKCLHLEKVIKESGCRTIGEFLWTNQKENKGIRFVPDRTTYYPLRKLYEEEFEAIKAKQEQYYPNINWNKIQEIIFYQRPLKPQERGKCQFMKDKERTFKAMPCSHEYRILQEVYNLDYHDTEGKPVKLTEEQIAKLIFELNQKKEMTFDQIRKLLKINSPFNLESDIRSKLNGNVTAAILRSEKKFGKLWDSFTLEEQDSITEELIIADEDSEVLKMLEKYDLTEAQKSSICGVTLSSGTTSYCKELTEKLVHLMQGDSLDTLNNPSLKAKLSNTEGHRFQFDVALGFLGYTHSDDTVEHCDLLPYYGKILTGSTIGGGKSDDEKKPEQKYGKIGNPTVHVALNQTRIVVNALIKKYGKPKQIVVELSRDLKASKDAKADMIKTQSANVKQNAILNKNITDLVPTIQYPSRVERLKYKLWTELGVDSLSRKCPYCGKVISGSELFTKNIEIEHILPFSRTLLDSESNKTLAHAHCNAKKGEHSPYEAFGQITSGDYCWDDIMERVSHFNKTKRSRFNSDAMESFEKDSGFLIRQLNDNKYLSKVARKYLTAVTEKPTDVWVNTGAMTKMLRDRWEMDSILMRKIDQNIIAQFNLKDNMVGEYKKNRYDHRHHAIDAMVIGLTDRSMVQAIAKANAQRTTYRLEVPPCPFTRFDITEHVKNIVVSFKPDHGTQGKLSKETLLGLIKQEQTVDIKSLTKDDIPNIKVPKIRDEFEEVIADNKDDIKKAIKVLQDTYPQVKIFKSQFVSRTPLTSLKTENNLEDIVDSKIRSNLQDYIAQHKGQKFEQCVMEFSNTTGIKKVRCKTRIQTPIVIQPDSDNPLSVTRYLNPEDYFTAIIWEIPPAKEGKKATYQAQYVRRTDIDKNGNPIENKPHPAAKKICQLCKNDYLEFSEKGIWKKARIAGYATTCNKLDIRPIYATGTMEDWIIATNDNVKESGWKPQEGHNFVAVNVLFGELSAHKITVDPIGQVFRNTKGCK